jgi:hypothetical protein
MSGWADWMRSRGEWFHWRTEHEVHGSQVGVAEECNYLRNNGSTLAGVKYSTISWDFARMGGDPCARDECGAQYLTALVPSRRARCCARRR